jgi:pimeloyl-ACP methyl ester carboxylesterase
LEFWSNFLIELSAGLVGVFAGAALALWADRRAREHHEEEERSRQREELANSRKLVISSVVKNTSETKRLGRLLESEEDPYLFQVTFESAVWEATRAQFVRIASVDERVLLTRFFDHVRRLSSLIDFHRKVRSDLEIRNSTPDAGDRRLLDDLRGQLRDVAHEIRIDGLVIVTDLGDDLHKRLLGINATGVNSVNS